MGSSNARKAKRKATRPQVEDCNEVEFTAAFPSASSASKAATPNANHDTDVQTAYGMTIDEKGRMRLDCHPDIEVKEIAGIGRGLFWSPIDGRAVEKGTTLLQLTPHAIVPHDQHVRIRCHVCFSPTSKDSTSLQACSGCHLVRYCSASCRAKDVEQHKTECVALQKLKKEKGSTESVDPGHLFRLAGRLLWGRHRLGKEWWTAFEGLNDHLDDPLYSNGLALMARIAMPYLKLGGQEVSLLDIRSTLAKLSYAYEISLSDQSTIVGTSMDAIGAMINHSCYANVHLSYPEQTSIGKPTHVVAIKTINPGDELTHCYCKHSHTFTDRQGYLFRGWHFHCRCSMCLKSINYICPCPDCAFAKQALRASTVDSTDQWLDPRTAQWCGRKACTGWVRQCPKTFYPVGHCNKCKQPSELSSDDVSETIKSGVKVMDKIKFLNTHVKADAKKIIEIAAPIMKKLSTIQPPCASPFYLLAQRVTIAVKQGELKEGVSVDDYRSMFDCVQTVLLAVEGMQMGGKDSILQEASVMRCLFLEELANYFLHFDSIIRQGMFQQLTRGQESRFSTRMPKINPMPEQMREYGLNLLRQAYEEYKICFGKDIEGGIRGRLLKEEIKMWEANKTPSDKASAEKMRHYMHVSYE